MAELPPLSKVRTETEQNRLDFLRADLKISFTFADLVMTELQMEHREAAQRALAKAEDGYGTIARLLVDLTEAEHRNEIARKLDGLLRKLNDVRSKFSAAAHQLSSEVGAARALRGWCD